MPGSLLLASSPTLRGVTRNESTRSDSSAASNTSQSSVTGNKKVSFNKAVRVKKYPRPKKNDSSVYDRDNDDLLPNGNGETTGKRFWFKVYKNKHRQNPDPSEFRRRNEVIYYGNDIHDGTNGYHDGVISYHPNPSVLNYPVLTSECGTQTPGKKSDSSTRTALLGNEYTPLHPSQMPSDPPPVKRNHVKKIVNRFNDEAVLQRHWSADGYPIPSPPASPLGSPKFHSTPKHIPIPPPPPPPVPPPGYEMNRSPPPEGLFSTSRFKKNPIVNGVKVMFGMGQPKKDEKIDSYSHVPNGDTKFQNKGPYKTEIVISDGSDTDIKRPYSPSDKFLYGDYDDNKALVKRNDKFDVSHKNRYHDDNDGYSYYYEDGDDRERRGKYHVETWDTGNQLVFDTTDVNTSTSKTDKGEFVSTVGEKHQLWQNNKRIIVYEEPSPTIIRRKAKSQSDLTKSIEKYSQDDKIDKGISTDELYPRKSDKKDTLTKKSKDSWLRHFRSSTKDKGVQCSKIPTATEPEELYSFGRYKIIRPRNGVVSAFSSVPTIEKTRQNSHQTSQHFDAGNSNDSVIYSQVDKSKKKRNSEKDKKKGLFTDESRIGGLFKSRSEPLYIGPPPKSQQHIEDELEDNFFEDRGERVIKTSKRGFGFKLNTGKENSSRNSYEDHDWYNIDGDVEASQRNRRNRNHRDIAEVRNELAFEEETDASSLSNGDHKRNGGGAGSVIREVDFKKREISYENVPRSDGENNSDQPVSGLWYREADEDYRREMAQNDVSYPAGSSVGSDRFYTVDRRDKSSKKLPPPSPRAYTLDRRHLKSKDKQKPIPNTTGVKILVNGKEMKDKSLKKNKKRDDPLSVQSDPLYVRGGLAAAYQARQRANVRRSNSTASGLSSKYRGSSSPNVRRIVAGSSEISAASSGSESGKMRRPLVMYIPGVSHPEKASENEDRVSSTIARSHSMMTPTRPPRMLKKGNQKSHKSSKQDIYRNGDIYEEDEIMPLASDYNKKKPPRVPSDSRKQNNIKRSHSIPKDTKFSWLKWRIRGKPSREP